MFRRFFEKPWEFKNELIEYIKDSKVHQDELVKYIGTSSRRTSTFISTTFDLFFYSHYIKIAELIVHAKCIVLRILDNYDINSITGPHGTLLNQLCYYGFRNGQGIHAMDLIYALIDKGAYINLAICGETCLHYLCKEGFRHNSDVDAVYAKKLALYIIDLGFNVNAKDNRNHTIFYVLCSNGFLYPKSTIYAKELALGILAKNVDIFATRECGNRSIGKLCWFGFSHPESAVHAKEVMFKILEYRDKFSDYHIKNALYSLYLCGFENSGSAVHSKEVMLAVIKSGFNVNTTRNINKSCDIDEYTMLHSICGSSERPAFLYMQDIILATLNNGFDLSLTDNDGSTVLHRLLDSIPPERLNYAKPIILEITRRTTNINLTNKGGKTPLDLLIRSNFKTVEIALDVREIMLAMLAVGFNLKGKESILRSLLWKLLSPNINPNIEMIIYELAMIILRNTDIPLFGNPLFDDLNRHQPNIVLTLSAKYEIYRLDFIKSAR